MGLFFEVVKRIKAMPLIAVKIALPAERLHLPGLPEKKMGRDEKQIPPLCLNDSR
jgi:hypothetical protein